MSFLTLGSCAGSVTRLTPCTSALLGGWVSMLTYRTAFNVNIAVESFILVDQFAMDPKQSSYSSFAPQGGGGVGLAISAVSFSYLRVVGCFPTLMFMPRMLHLSKGAICRSLQRPEVVRTLWKSCKSKGSLHETPYVGWNLPFADLRFWRRQTTGLVGLNLPSRPLGLLFRIFGGVWRVR